MFSLPLELTGQLVGVELILMSVVLMFRHRYVDGFHYPWQIPWSFFTAGAAVVLIVTEVVVAGILRSFDVTMLGYLTIGLMGLVGFHYFWLIYPYQQRTPPGDSPGDGTE